MFKRLGIGLLKGLLLGIVVGAAFHFGLRWRVADGLLGYLIAAGAGATAGILAGKPPWKHEAAVESLLKSVVGLGVGAGVYWALVRFASFAVPLPLEGVPDETAWTSLPLLFAPPVAALFGLLVELDNTDGDVGKKKKALKDPPPAADVIA